MKVIKKNGNIEEFDSSKIIRAIGLSCNRVKKELTKEQMEEIIQITTEELKNRGFNNSAVVNVQDIHFAVETALNKIDKDIYYEYRSYNSYKTRFNMSFDKLLQKSKKIIYQSEEERENANKNSVLQATQKELLSALIGEELMLEYELPVEASQKHKEGESYYHDLADRIYFGYNCNLFDMDNVLTDGFEMDGVKLKEASDIFVACRHISNITLNASANQYGGFSYDMVEALSPFVKKTREKYIQKYKERKFTGEQIEKFAEEDTWEELYENIKSLQYEINLLMNANSQTPFLTWGLRLWGNKDEKMVIKAILMTRMQKMGVNKLDFIFPKLVIAHRKELVDKELYELAVKCSSKAMYPDWLSLDKGYLKEVFERTGKIIYPMGCVDGQEIVTYKINNTLFVESFERMWDRLSKIFEVKEQEAKGNYYIDLKDVLIYDNKNGFVNTYRIIKNKDKGDWTRVKFSNGRSLLATSDHPLPTDKGRVFIKDLKIGDSIKINQKQYSENLINYNLDKAWLLGFLLCDGCYDGQLSSSIALTGEDDIETNYKKAFKDIYNLDVETIVWNRGKRGDYKELKIRTGTYKTVQNELIELFGGLQKIKRQIPNEVFSWCEDARMSFLAGMIDADGYINSSGNTGSTVQLGSTNKELALQTMALAQSLELPSKVYLNHYTSKDKSKIRYRIEFSATIKLLKYMACHKKIDCFTREANITKTNLANVTSIEFLGKLNKFSYDVTTESDYFEVSGIQSHNCRAFLAPFIDENGNEIYTGRFNIGAVTMVLPEIVIKSKNNYNKFIEILDENMDIAYKTHEYFYEKIGKRKASINPLFFTQGGAYKKLNSNDTLDKILDCATASFGYLGLDEAVFLLSGKRLNENIELGKKIMKHMKDKVNQYKEISGHLYALYGTPSEGLADKALRKIEEKHGYIEGVTDKEWLTNSHHVDVREEVTALEKMDVEEKLWEYPTGGRIFYTEFPHTDNIEALKTAINEAMKRGFYFGINFENGTCLDCGYQGDFTGVTKCSNCGSTNITVVDRVCGYLGFRKQKGKTRYNHGKECETLQRVKHYNVRVD